MRRDHRILTQLFELAQDVDTSDVSHAARVAAAVVLKGRIISWGVNERKSHPFQQQFSKNEHAVYWHAETRAIWNALKRIDESKMSACDVYVARACLSDRMEWCWGLARPCMGCSKAILTHGFRRVFYTLDKTGHWGSYYPDTVS